jgi:hypothetical protein
VYGACSQAWTISRPASLDALIGDCYSSMYNVPHCVLLRRRYGIIRDVIQNHLIQVWGGTSQGSGATGPDALISQCSGYQFCLPATGIMLAVCPVIHCIACRCWL